MAQKQGQPLGSFRAYAAISAKEGYGVKASTTEAFTLDMATAGSVNIGVITDNSSYAAGEAVPVAGDDGDIVQFKAGVGGFAAGDFLKTDASGTWVVAGSGDYYTGQALEAAAAGYLGYGLLTRGVGSANGSMVRSGTDVRPANAGDAIQTDNPATVAKVLDLDDNIISSNGTDAAVDIILDPKGTGGIDIVEGIIKASGAAADVDIQLDPKGTGSIDIVEGKIKASGAGDDVNIALTPKGAGVVTNGTDPLLPYKKASQGTTGTGAALGQIACVGVTANAVILVTPAEDLGANLALSDVVAGVNLFTVYTRNTNTDARAALDTKKVNYLVISY